MPIVDLTNLPSVQTDRRREVHNSSYLLYTIIMVIVRFTDDHDQELQEWLERQFLKLNRKLDNCLDDIAELRRTTKRRSKNRVQYTKYINFAKLVVF